MRNMKKFVAILLLGAILTATLPRSAQALTFGGRITSSRFKICKIYVGVALIPVPMQIITIIPAGTSPAIIAYTYYAFILQLFGISTSLYNYYQFFRVGPKVLGTYAPAPVPWVDCPELLPTTNFILKIGTSLY
jgi:hypothetical protein